MAVAAAGPADAATKALLIRSQTTWIPSQAAQFGDLVVGLPPSKRLLYYRQMWAAAEQQVGS